VGGGKNGNVLDREWENTPAFDLSRFEISLDLFAFPGLEALASIAQQGRDLDFANDFGSRTLQPTSLLGQEIPLARRRIVRPSAWSVLERTELVATFDLEHDVLVDRQEREDVEDEELELDPVWLGRLYDLWRVRVRLDRWDLLARNVIRHLGRERSDRFEELGRIEMIRDVGCAELERRWIRGVTLFGNRLWDLAVLDDSPLSPFDGDDADRLFRARLCNDLCATSRAARDAVSQEGRIGWADETVVNAIRMEVLDTTRFKIREHGQGGRRVERCTQSGVDASVSIWGNGQLGWRGKEELAVVRKTRERAYIRNLVRKRETYDCLKRLYI
jgi:hypothetical protein